MEKTFPPDVIECDELRLVRFDPTQAAALYAAIEENRARLEPFLPWVPGVRSVDDEDGALRRAHQQWDAGNEFAYVIFPLKSDEVLGSIGTHSLAWDHDACEIGYWLTSDAEGKGVVTASVGLLEQTFFAMGFHRIEIRCRADNTRSARVAERCGYRIEGRLRQNMLRDGAYYDTLVYGKLRGE